MISQNLIIDFDSTFVTVEALEELAKLILKDNPEREGIQREIHRITQLGMVGSITFQESLSRRLKLIQPTEQRVEELIDILKEHVSPSFKQHSSFLKENAQSIYIVSGGFREFVIPVVVEYGIRVEHVCANSFIFDSTGKFISYDTNNPLSRSGGKVIAVRNLNLKGEIWVIGDAYTDYELKKEGVATKFIAYTESSNREPVTRLADVVVNNFGEVVRLVSS